MRKPDRDHEKREEVITASCADYSASLAPDEISSGGDDEQGERDDTVG